MKVNKDKLQKILSEIFEALESLKELNALDKENFIKDKHKLASAKYNLIVAIEGIIDISNHIISKNRLRPPSDYADTFKVLYEAKIIEADYMDTLIKMVRFRNRLIHIYWEVENEEVFEIIRNRLSDIEKFLKIVNERFLKENPVVG